MRCCSVVLLLLCGHSGAALVAATPEFDPNGTKACWIVNLPRWTVGPEYEGLFDVFGGSRLEFRSSAATGSEILVALHLHPFSKSGLSGYGENRYWVSTTGKRALRSATAAEWDAARKLWPSFNKCTECKAIPNGVQYEDWRLIRSHKDREVWKVSLLANKSPDGRWLVLRSFDGYDWQSGGGALGEPGSQGAKGYDYYDVFDLESGRKVVTFGGYSENKSGHQGLFQEHGQPSAWYASHYYIGALTDKQQAFLLCNPALADIKTTK